LFTGIPVKLEEDVYALFKKGKEIFRGTKKEIEALAKKLDELGDEAGKKYLDNINKRKNALSKWSSKFDSNFTNHLSGDIAIEKITILYRELFYVGTKGQGGHWLNQFLKIDELVPPPNYINVADIPLDTPFRARVSVKSIKGKLFPKDAVSTMFPKNWSKERITEEVAYVYENTVAKGVGFKNEVKSIKNYEGLTTSGFEIRIQILNNKIINSHPINL
jgi:hypothetical protein